jgi:hypothetical protein
MKKEIINTTKILITAFILSLGISTIYAWTAPTQTPPAGNTSAPINVGSIGQYKSSNLGIGGEISAVNGYFSKKVGVGVVPPTDPNVKMEVKGALKVDGHIAVTDNFDISKNFSTMDSLFFGNIYTALTGKNDLVIGFDTNNDGNGNLRVIKGGAGLPSERKLLTVINNGNVGIGVASPTSKLEVAGDITATSGGDVCNSSGDCLSTVGGGGTITSISEGTGIDLNPNTITTTGTVSLDTTYTDSRYINVGETGDNIADNTIDSSEIEDGSLTSSDINIGSIQTRVSGTCSVGSSIRSIAANGTVICETDDVGAGRVTGGFQDSSTVGGTNCENVWGSAACGSGGSGGFCNTGTATLVLAYNTKMYLCIL